MTESSHAVFLSYASQDAEAAQRICEALRARGIEVWFDQSELRGGDAWDQSIRRQIKNCALFVPVISRHTHERAEGYFRLEWKLAIDRSHLIMANKPFLLPIVIDDTDDDDENVPDRFREVQWTRLRRGDATRAFVEHVQHLLSDGASTAIRPEAGSRNVPMRERPARSWRLLLHLTVTLAVMIVAAVAYLAIDKPWISKPAAMRVSVTPASIAVLPLTNESGDASQQYFSDGISEDLINALGQFPGLKVIGRISAFQFRDSKEDSRSIGAKLGVAHLLEGSVQKAGDMIRVSAELIDTRDGSMQWSDHYDRPYKDLFALQDEITRAVAGSLKAKLVPGEHAAAQSEQPPSGSLEAYNALLQGRFYDLRDTEADTRKAIEFFTQATQLDPRYALAWSELAHGWTLLSGDFLEGAAAQEAYAKARAAVDRALALSPDLAAAHNAKGDLLQFADFDWHGAESEYRRALESAPNDAQAKFNLGTQLAAYGELDQAIDLTRQALATEPLRAIGYRELANYLLGLHRFDEAELAMKKAIELQPSAPPYHVWLTVIEIQRNNAPAALAAAQQVPTGSYRDMALAFAQQVSGDRNAADSALRTFIEKDANIAAYQIAEVFALRNDAKATFEWLDRAWNNRDVGIQFLLYDPFIQRYKNDPRFAAFCHKVRLPVPGETSAAKSA